MNTTNLNKTTKKAESWIAAYNNSSCYSVSDFYVSNVKNKRSIESAIKARLIANNLVDYKVIKGNTFYFTCGFLSADKKLFTLKQRQKFMRLKCNKDILLEV